MDKSKLSELLDRELNNSDDTALGAFVNLLIKRCREQNTVPLGTALAGAFDILVGLFYYQKIPNRGWLLCTHGDEKYFFPFVNVCPRCAIEQEPFFHKAGKSQSANIGAATTRALILFIQEWFNSLANPLRVCKGEEPVDLIIFDEANQILLLAEVKSAPLFTLPLVAFPENGSEELNIHESITIGSLKGTRLGVLLPTQVNDAWQTIVYEFYKPFDSTDDFFIGALSQLIADDLFFKNYLQTWSKAFKAYATKNKQEPIFWLTNGCGTPSPTPDGWPDRSGSGRESISDGKTSVGLDRTDDIKKGVYQLLKLRMSPIAQHYSVKVGIVSNTHAARHHSDYIQPLEDIMWLQSDLSDIKFSGQLPENTPVHNLFDGIVTFTKTFSRDRWIQKSLNFNE